MKMCFSEAVIAVAASPALRSYCSQNTLQACTLTLFCLFVCVEVLWPSQPNGVMSSAVSLPNQTFTGQA